VYDDGILITESGVGPLDIEPTGPVTMEERQGVFLHGFRCSRCCLHFALVSWLPDRHRVGEVACPECREVTPMVHWLSVLSRSHHMVREGPPPRYSTWFRETA